MKLAWPDFQACNIGYPAPIPAWKDPFVPIHPSAIVDSRAQIDPTAVIGPYVVIEGPVVVGAETRIGPFCHLLGETTIGERCEIHTRVSIGDIPQDRAFRGESSGCTIGNDVILREGVAIHRGTGEGTVTSIGDGCFLMTNAHVGHNCELEKGVIMISGSLLGGHVHVGERAVISGNTGVHQFVRIGTLAMIAGLARISQDVPPYMMTDQFGTVIAINLVGLKRAGFNADERKDIKEAFRLLYREGLTQRHAVELLLEKYSSPIMTPLLDFLSETSLRGVTKGAA